LFERGAGGLLLIDANGAWYGIDGSGAIKPEGWHWFVEPELPLYAVVSYSGPLGDYVVSYNNAGVSALSIYLFKDPPAD
jgi:hypothetical protein